MSDRTFPLDISPVSEASGIRRLHADGLSFEVQKYTHGSTMPAHAHEYAHFVFHLQGNVAQVYRKQSHLATPGTLVYLPRGEVHATEFQDAVRAFQIVLRRRWLERLWQSSAFLDKPVNHTSGPATGIALRLYREFQQPDNVSPLMLEGLMLELLAVMSRQPTNSTESHVPRWLKQARDLLHNRFTENLSLAEIAASVGVHPSHLTESFRLHYHCTVGDYIRRLRVEYAVHLLGTFDMPASQIAHAVGFADQSHFCRTFKRLTGMTPLQFQKRNETDPCLRQHILFRDNR